MSCGHLTDIGTLTAMLLLLATGPPGNAGGPDPAGAPGDAGPPGAAEPAAEAARPAEQPPTSPPSAADSAEAVDRGRTLTRRLLEGRVDSVSAVLAPAYRKQLGGALGVASFVGKVVRQLGSAQEDVVTEVAYTDRRVHSYYRISRFSSVPGRTVTTRWSWREGDGAVVAVGVRPTPRPAATGHEDYATKADLRLPFRGRWYVAWGGRRVYQNYHAQARDQRFAYDFLVLRDGVSHAGDGTSNDDYYCFGRPILASAAGRVVEAVDTVSDNTPGEMNREAIFGNHVVLDHGNGEFSVLAHLRHGSVAVETGDRVVAGQRLGACGNSGHSSEPHLHLHLQDGPVPGQATGFPAPFHDYVADGRPVETGKPTRGQTIRRAGESTATEIPPPLIPARPPAGAGSRSSPPSPS